MDWDDVYSVIEVIKTTLGALYAIVMMFMAMEAALSCFFGYKLFKIKIAITGFFIGAVAGGFIGALFGASASIKILPSAIIGALLFGILGAFLANKVYIIAVFMDGVFWGFLIFLVILLLCGAEEASFVIAIIGGLITGIIGCFLKKEWIIFRTALEGGTTLGLIITISMGNVPSGIFLGIICVVAGIIIQNVMERKAPAAIAESASLSQNPSIQQAQVALDEKSTMSKKQEQAGMGLFVQEIEKELSYVFSADIINQIRQLPEFYENGEWVCSCGQKCSADICPRCGMEMKEAYEKLNYTYLKSHKEQREAAEQEQRRIEEEQRRLEQEARRQEAERKARELAEKTKQRSEAVFAKLKIFVKQAASFIWKYKKFIIPIVVCIIIFIIIINNNTVRMGWYNKRAAGAKDLDKKRELYFKAIDEKDNITSWLGLLNVAIESDSPDPKMIFNLLEENYPDNKEFVKIKEEHKPDAPVANLEDGTYDTWKWLSYTAGEKEYIYYSINNGEYQEFVENLPLQENGDFVYQAYSENKLGIKSDTVSNHYILKVDVPQPVVIDSERQEYFSSTEIKMEQPDGLDIYYTTDGSDPDQNSIKYEDPVICERGSTVIKAGAFNPNGIGSKITTKNINVRYPAVNNEAVASGYKNDYVGGKSGIHIFNADGNQVGTLNDSREAWKMQFHQGRLYYIDGSEESNVRNVMFYDEEDEGNGIIMQITDTDDYGNIRIGGFQIAYNRLWYTKCHTDTSREDTEDVYEVYSSNLDGSDFKDHGLELRDLDTDGDILYGLDNTYHKIYRINEDMSSDQVFDIRDYYENRSLGGGFYITDDTLFFISIGEGYGRLEMFKDGKITILSEGVQGDIYALRGGTNTRAFFNKWTNGSFEGSYYYDVEKGEVIPCGKVSVYPTYDGYYATENDGTPFKVEY